MNSFQRGYYDVLVKLGLDDSTPSPKKTNIPPKPKKERMLEQVGQLAQNNAEKILKKMPQFQLAGK